jgi:SecY interacting protein Syd
MTSVADNHTARALDAFMQRLTDLHQPDSWPLTPYDPDWPSPCYQQEAATGVRVLWRPVLNTDGTDLFEGLSNALEQPIHPSVITFYSRYWSDHIPTQLPDGREVSLLQIWNREDFERLRGNLIGHALSKQKQKRPLTLFFATLEPDTDRFFSVDNTDGGIWLERAGKAPLERISDSLADFLDQLTPLKLPDVES